MAKLVRLETNDAEQQHGNAFMEHLDSLKVARKSKK